MTRQDEIRDKALRTCNATKCVPNFALAGYRAPENYKAESCPLCQAGTPVSSF